ncbi:MAG: ATP-binding protein [Verrucomicrobiota bacterium]
MNPEISLCPSGWKGRRTAAQEVCWRLASRHDDEDAMATVLNFAVDPKWEVRKVVAEALASFTERQSQELSGVMARESHAMVEAAIRRSLSRRELGASFAPKLEGLFLEKFEDIRTRYGMDAAEAAREMAEKFTALHLRSAVHDIRNIITYLKPSAELIADPIHQGNVKKIIWGRSYLRRILDMMDNYSAPLTVLKSEENVLEIVEESLADALAQIAEDGYNHSKVKARIDLPGLGSFSVARLEIVMAFTNLIKNAIEAHGRQAGKILPGVVEIGGAIRDGFIQIQIRDHGNGLPQSSLVSLLRFIPGNTSKHGGSGYGLPLANRYITAHGGTLALESEENEGTTATVFLPILGTSDTIP